MFLRNFIYKSAQMCYTNSGKNANSNWAKAEITSKIVKFCVATIGVCVFRCDGFGCRTFLLFRQIKRGKNAEQRYQRIKRKCSEHNSNSPHPHLARGEHSAFQARPSRGYGGKKQRIGRRTEGRRAFCAQQTAQNTNEPHIPRACRRLVYSLPRGGLLI